jgi:hypothetical protein
MRYLFRCYVDGDFTIDAPMAEGPPTTVYCPLCHEESLRVFEDVPTYWHTGGAHGREGQYAGDYGKHGDKLEQLNANWSKRYGEKPPAPAKDVPKNLKEPY